MIRPLSAAFLVVALLAAHLVETGAPEAAARRQETEGLQEVSLARAIGADQHDRLRTAIEPQLPVVAKVGQA